MRLRVILSAVIGFMPLTVTAQQYSLPPGCVAPAPNYGPACSQPAPAPVPAPAPTGNFLRGPGTGQAAGETRSFGLRGGRLHLPEITINLPTFELPSPIKFRRDAEMLFDASRGPLSPAPVQDFGALPSAPAPVTAPAGPAPVYTPYVAPACSVPAACTTDNRTLELEQRLANLAKLEKELSSLRDQYAQKLEQNDQPTRNDRAATASLSKLSTREPMQIPQPVSIRPWFINASYEEEATDATPIRIEERNNEKHEPRESKSAAKLFDENESADQFGVWSKARRRGIN